MSRIPTDYFRNFIFGVEDSLVSTVGLLSGISIAGVSQGTIFMTGLVLIFVEAFSMSAGSFLSEYSAEEYAKSGTVSPRRPFVDAVIMFLSYFVSGFIPLLPYLILSPAVSLEVSIVSSAAALFILGLISGKLTRKNLIAGGLRMLAVGGIAIGVGMFVGRIANLTIK